jgi:polar amino acid transport system substrate-binding protein
MVLLTIFTSTICITNICFAAERPKVIVAGDYWCPYNCDPSDKKPGILIELLKSAFIRHDIDVEYIMMPWSQALQQLSAGTIDMVIGANRSDIPDAILVSTYIKSETSAFSNRQLIYDSDSLQYMIVGMTVRYTYPKEVQNYITSTYTAHQDRFRLDDSANSVAGNINNLLSKKIDIFFDDTAVIKYYLEKNAIQGIYNCGVVNNDDAIIHVAFSNFRTDNARYAEFLISEFKNMYESSNIAEMCNKYGVACR